MPVRVDGYVALLREIVTVDAIEGVRTEVKILRQPLENGPPVVPTFT